MSIRDYAHMYSNRELIQAHIRLLGELWTSGKSPIEYQLLKLDLMEVSLELEKRIPEGATEFMGEQLNPNRPFKGWQNKMAKNAEPKED